MVNIPNYLSQDDMGLMVSLEAETSFNEMMQSIGLNELHTLEESGEIIVQEASAKTLKDKFFEWLNKIWNAIKALYDKVMAFIKKQIDKVKAHLAKAAQKTKADLKKKAGLLNDKTKDGKKKTFGKAHTWDGFDDVINGRGAAWKCVNVFDNFIDSIPAINTGASEKSYGKDFGHGAIMAYNDKTREKIKAASEKINANAKAALGVQNLNSDTIQNKVKKLIAGKEIEADKAYIVSHFDDLFDYGTDFGKTTSDLKKTLKETEKKFDMARKDIEGFMRKLSTGGSGTGTKGKTETQNVTDLNTILTNMKKGKIVLVAVNNAILANVKARCSEASSFVLRVAFAGKKKEESTNESALIPSSFQTELASLFEI